MSDSKKDTDIHRPDGFILKGEKIGHSDEKSKIRDRDGIFFRGEELGYVDKENKIRQKDGFIFKGDEVGKVKDKAAHGKDGFFFEGEQWGYVDDEGNVRLKDGIFFRGRIIGQVKGKNISGALGFFVLKFKELEERFEKLKDEVGGAKNKVALLGKVQHMLSYVPEFNGLGDFDKLLKNLRSLESEILREQRNRKSKKENICSQAESLSHSTEWKQTSEKLKSLQQEWKEIGFAGKDDDENLWNRFRRAQDTFYEKKKQHFEQLDKQRQRSREKKESICSRAESLSYSSNWKETGNNLKGLMEEWKKAGSAGKDYDEPLWQRFRHAQDKFYERREAFFEERKREERENQSRKESICSEAESLAYSSDYKSAKERIKSLQEKWKTIGHVPREKSDELWNRFRQAADRVFENARREQERKQEEWKDKMRETLNRKREQVEKLKGSVRHDESNVSRWRDTIYSLNPGGRADEIRDSLESKIDDVEDRIRDKERKIDELEDSIRDIESRLYR